MCAMYDHPCLNNTSYEPIHTNILNLYLYIYKLEMTPVVRLTSELQYAVSEPPSVFLLTTLRLESSKGVGMKSPVFTL